MMRTCGVYLARHRNLKEAFSKTVGIVHYWGQFPLPRMFSFLSYAVLVLMWYGILWYGMIWQRSVKVHQWPVAMGAWVLTDRHDLVPQVAICRRFRQPHL